MAFMQFCELGGLGEEGWFGDASVIAIHGRWGEIVGRDDGGGESVGQKADEEDDEDVVQESHGV